MKMLNNYRDEKKSSVAEKNLSVSQIEAVNKLRSPKQEVLPINKKGLSQSRLLPVFWVIAMLATGLIASSFTSESEQFFGIATSEEKSVSFRYPVEIVQITVLEGQNVKQGDLLLKVRRYDLTSALLHNEEMNTELSSRIMEIATSQRAELRNLEANERRETSIFDVDIAKVKAQLELSKRWQDGARQADKTNTSSSYTQENILVVKLRGLQQQREHVVESYQSQIENLKSQLNTEQRPLDVKLAMIENQRLELERQAESLNVYADISGQIGSVMFSAGEQVEEFQAILNIHQERSVYVKAYIHESAHNSLEIGSRVHLESINLKKHDQPVKGEIKSLGNRVVEFPIRLKRNPMISVWGREVVIEIEQDNSFLFGEKVTVFFESSENKEGVWHQVKKIFGGMFSRTEQAKNENRSVSFSSLSLSPSSLFKTGKTEAYFRSDYFGLMTNRTHLESSFLMRAIDLFFSKLTKLSNAFEKKGGNAQEQSLYPINVYGLEASAVVWDREYNLYWVISDESNLLYGMNENGVVVKKIQVQGLEIKDPESISLWKDRLYIGASGSFNKKGNRGKKRRLFVELVRDKSNYWRLKNKLDIVDILSNSLKSSVTNIKSDNFIKTIVDKKNIDIESHQVIGNSLFLGLKSPRDNLSRSIVLRFDDLESLFNGESPKVKIWRTIDFSNREKRQREKLSDMLFFEDKLYLTTVNAKNATSSLWVLDSANDQLVKLKQFDDHKAEGIAIKPDQRRILVVFDGGKRGRSMYAYEKLYATELD